MIDYIQHAKRIIIKIGSALVTDEKGLLRTAWMRSLAEDIAILKQQGKQVVLVSSGAVALGREKLKVGNRPLKLSEKQAAAACGQAELITCWQSCFTPYHYTVGQVLLTLEDSEVRRRHLNARHALDRLLKLDIIPIINENDAVATTEMRFGDNDRLAARVAEMVSAEMLVLFSDVDGLYTANPHKDDNAEHIRQVNTITEDIKDMADGKGSAVSSGGMSTKIEAAKIATDSGCHLIIADGRGIHPLRSLLEGAHHTLFLANESPEKVRHRWLAHNLMVSGVVVVDDGAMRALYQGSSLLSAGVKSTQGEFMRGDVVAIHNLVGNEIGRGIVTYNYEEAKMILGKKTSQFPPHLQDGRNELIHRDDMVVFVE